jgi:hypothetical protein
MLFVSRHLRIGQTAFASKPAPTENAVAWTGFVMCPAPCGTGFSRQGVRCHTAERMPYPHFAMSRRRIDVVRIIRRRRLAGECSGSVAISVFDRPRSPASRLLQRMRWPSTPCAGRWAPCGTGFSRESVGCHTAERMPYPHFAMSRRRTDAARTDRNLTPPN